MHRPAESRNYPVWLRMPETAEKIEETMQYAITVTTKPGSDLCEAISRS